MTDLTQVKSSEDHLRNFSRRWAAFMDVKSGDELVIWRTTVMASGSIDDS